MSSLNAVPIFVLIFYLLVLKYFKDIVSLTRGSCICPWDPNYNTLTGGAYWRPLYTLPNIDMASTMNNISPKTAALGLLRYQDILTLVLHDIFYLEQ